jgi:DNA-binding CsgD family transcriptional regulator
MVSTKKRLVENLLRKNTDGLTITEIALLLKITRNTVAVALAELKGEGKLRIREVGMAKLHYLERGGQK